MTVVHMRLPIAALVLGLIATPAAAGEAPAQPAPPEQGALAAQPAPPPAAQPAPPAPPAPPVPAAPAAPAPRPPAEPEQAALTPAQRGAAELGPGGTYVVKPGDTLADISQRFLGDARRWREIWERNRFIPNPNRIYPGDTLVIPGFEGPPARAEAPKPPPPSRVEAPPPPPPPPVARVEEPPPPPPAPLPFPVAPPDVIACASYVAEITGALGTGAIIQGTDRKILLGFGDALDLKMDPGQRAAVGDTFALLASEGLVRHPFTNQVIGVMIRPLGVVEINLVAGEAVRGRVLISCGSINPGDRVDRLVPVIFPYGKEAVPTSLRAEGTIVGSPQKLQNLGYGNIIFVDVGANKGLVPGDVLAIYQEGGLVEVPPPTGGFGLVAPTRMGEMIVLRTTPTTATAVISVSEKEIRVGMRAVLSRKIP